MGARVEAVPRTRLAGPSRVSRARGSRCETMAARRSTSPATEISPFRPWWQPAIPSRQAPASQLRSLSRCRLEGRRPEGGLYGAQLRADQEAPVERRFERKAGAASRDHVHGPAGMRPALVLLAIHPELAARDLADFHVDSAELEFADLEAHGGAAIAAPPRLLKHDRSMRRLQLLDQPAGVVRDGHVVQCHQKNPSAFCE